MGPVLSLSEIERLFDSESVLLDDPELDEHLRVVRGRVVWHSKDRDEVYQKAIALRTKRPAILFTGERPAGTAVVS